jgi:hypothetical protein
MDAVAALVWALVVCGVFPPSSASPNFSKRADFLNIIVRLVLSLLYFYSQVLRPSIVQKDVTSKTYAVTKVLVRVVVVAYGLAVLFFTTCRNGNTPRSFSVRARSPFSLLLGYSFCAFSALVFAQTFNWNEIYRISALIFYLATSGCVLLLCLQMVLIQYFTQQVKIRQKLPNLLKIENI